MKKKIFGGMLVIALAAIAAFNVNLNTVNDNNLSFLSLANMEALAQDNGEEEEKTCYKIKNSCSCYKDNEWKGMRIIDCEEYKLVPPLECHTCSPNQCSSGSCK